MMAVACGTIALALLLTANVASAFAGKAATGEPLFYPCTSCHPVDAKNANKKLPNGFKSHQIVIAEHAVLGKGSAACLVCHDDPAADPGKLKLVDGTLVDITGDVSKVCYRCHSAIYKEFEDGAHGHGEAKCTASGCHDPHTPGYIFGEFLLPFVGNGFQVEVLPAKQPFTPLAVPARKPPVETPGWLTLSAIVGVAVAGGIAGTLIRGRSK
jgi:hypothetical protein